MKHAVMGDGFGSLLAVSEALVGGEEVIWFAGSGMRTLPVLPVFPDEPQARKILAHWERLGLSFEERELGADGLREFRGGNFRRLSILPENDDIERFLPPERLLLGSRFLGFDPSPIEIESEWRGILLAHDSVERIEEKPVTDLLVNEDSVSVKLGSGEKLEFLSLVYADSWAKLAAFKGVDKGLRKLAKAPSYSLLQIRIRTEEPLPFAEPQMGFLATLQKESGEEEERRIWGAFLQDPRWSQWSLFLDAEEAEDNHAISKRIRRIHQALGKMAEAAGGSYRQEEESIRLETGILPSLPFSEKNFGLLRLMPEFPFGWTSPEGSADEAAFAPGTTQESSSRPHP